MASKNRILSNIFSNWVFLFLNIVVSFFLAPFVVHQLGNVYYGVWVIMMQFTSYLYLMDFGVRESVIRYISKYDAESDDKGPRTKINNILCASMAMYWAIGLACLVVTGILAYYFDSIFQIPEDAVSDARWVVIISGITLAQFFQFNAYTGILMGFQRFAIFNQVGIIILLIRAAIIVYLLSAGHGIVALALVQLGIGLANNIIIYFIAKRLMKSQGVPFDFHIISYKKHKEEYKSIFNYSIFVLINNIGQKAIFHTDAIVIGIFLPAASVTFYAIAGTLSDYLVKICAAGVQALNPLTSELDTKGKNDQLKNVAYIGCKLSLIVSLPVICVFITMGANFIGIWMGDEFTEISGNLLIMFAILQMYSLPHYTLASVLYGISKHHLIANLRITEAVFNVALSVTLIHSMGLYGVALGTMIPHFISVVIVLPWLIKDIIGINLFHYYVNTYFRPIVGSIPFFIVCYYTNESYPAESLVSFMAIVAVLIPVYFIPVWFLSFTKDERSLYGKTLSGYVFRKKQKLEG
ncbi:MAG: oligosaccharide flippase family protein [Gammaproteobacteria bacterium]|nr:oligosaccharide flippase family protein [Gammaproteobacteria bacterium]